MKKSIFISFMYNYFSNKKNKQKKPQQQQQKQQTNKTSISHKTVVLIKKKILLASVFDMSLWAWLIKQCTKFVFYTMTSTIRYVLKSVHKSHSQIYPMDEVHVHV